MVIRLTAANKGRAIVVIDESPRARTTATQLGQPFNFTVEYQVARARNGEHQTIETLINEEALLFAKYLRWERKNWDPKDFGDNLSVRAHSSHMIFARMKGVCLLLFINIWPQFQS